MREVFYVYTDGSSSPKQKDGGWAFCVADREDREVAIIQGYGYEKNTTNNRMELVSVINSLKYIYNNKLSSTRRVVVFSDSQYVGDPIYFGWLGQWQEGGWKRPVYNHKTGETTIEDTKNKDLWVELISVMRGFTRRNIAVEIRWVKGHSGNVLNDHCDTLAKNARYSKSKEDVYEEALGN